MGYFILILTMIVYLIRPAEWIEVLYFNWNMLLNGLSIIIISSLLISKKHSISYDRLTGFLLFFVFAMVISNIVNFQFSTIVSYYSLILSTIVVFILTQASITTPKQIDNFILILILLILFICYQCYLQVTVGANWGGLEPISRGLMANEEGIATTDYQVMWFGILEDPNDLGMLLVAFSPYIFNKIFFQKTNLLQKSFWLLSFLIIVYTIVLTNSRGSLISLIGGLSALFIIKHKSVTGVVFAVILGLVLLSFGPSRMGELTSGDNSAMGRVYAWVLAIQLLAQSPLFGIGSHHFLDYHYLTTHNSYVLAFVETGLFGFIAYLSLFIVTVYVAIKVSYDEKDVYRRNETIALLSGLIAIMISIFFITRTYVLLPFLYIAIISTYLKVYSFELKEQYINKITFPKLSVIAVGFIVFVYIFNRLATSLLL